MKQDWHDYFLTPEEKRIKMLEELVDELQDRCEKLKGDKEALLKLLDEKSRKDLDNVINNIDVSKCEKCINEVKCKVNGVYKSNCKDYKRDSPDGGYYG